MATVNFPRLGCVPSSFTAKSAPDPHVGAYMAIPAGSFGGQRGEPQRKVK